jgi:hypothetical protein
MIRAMRVLAVVLASIAVAAAGAAFAASATASAIPRQRVSCIVNGKESACTTRMRLVCHQPAFFARARTTLSRIPRTVLRDGVWRLWLGWGDGNSSPVGRSGVKRGRFSVATPLGGKPQSAEAIVDLPHRQTVIISSRCIG